jgi:hypothetical protein
MPICKSCGCLLSSKRCLNTSFALILRGLWIYWPCCVVIYMTSLATAIVLASSDSASLNSAKICCTRDITLNVLSTGILFTTDLFGVGHFSTFNACSCLVLPHGVYLASCLALGCPGTPLPPGMIQSSYFPLFYLGQLLWRIEIVFPMQVAGPTSQAAGWLFTICLDVAKLLAL